MFLWEETPEGSRLVRIYLVTLEYLLVLGSSAGRDGRTGLDWTPLHVATMGGFRLSSAILVGTYMYLGGCYDAESRPSFSPEHSPHSKIESEEVRCIGSDRVARFQSEGQVTSLVIKAPVPVTRGHSI
jgi:hypothetical protein